MSLKSAYANQGLRTKMSLSSRCSLLHFDMYKCKGTTLIHVHLQMKYMRLQFVGNPLFTLVHPARVIILLSLFSTAQSVNVANNRASMQNMNPIPTETFIAI